MNIKLGSKEVREKFILPIERCALDIILKSLVLTSKEILLKAFETVLCGTK